MKKFYTAGVVCLLCAAWVNAQTFYWVGSLGSNWNNSNNWSATSGGPGGAGVPNDASHNVILDQTNQIAVDLTGIVLNTLTVTNSITAQLSPISGSTTITVSSTSAVTPALTIDAGSKLIDSASTSPVFTFAFGNGAKAVINGEWYFTGNTGDLSTFTIPSTGGLGNRIDINNGGKITFKNFTVTPSNSATGDEYLFFNSGSMFHLDRNGGTVTRATWDPNSTVNITGVVTTGISINETTDLGHLIYNSPLQSITTGLALINLNIRGNLQVLNTNDRILYISGNGSESTESITNTVFGNFDVGANSHVILSNIDGSNKTVTFQINGNLNAGGSTFNIQQDAFNNIVSNSTTLLLKGNLNHTAGTFTASATATNNSVDLYIVELNGTSSQTIFSHNGNIDNTNNQITLRMNNAAGATLLSPLAVGKIDFNTTNKGILTTTSTNVLTINNTGTSGLVVNTPSNAGHVNGPVRRNLAGNTTYLFPTGKGGTFRGAQVIPINNSVYEAEYFNTAHSDLSVLAPLTGVSNVEYWNIFQISGSDAAIQLSLAGAVPGAQADDAVVVAKYNGTDWENAKGLTGIQITPGNATTGTARSSALSANGAFTFGYGPQSALPIRLITFNARKLSATSAQIHWKITATSTPDKFEVLKSSDGINFRSISDIVAIDGKENYEMVDNNLSRGTTYYRLRMIDKDGTGSLSKIVAVLNGGKTLLITSMMPTVVLDRARLNISSSENGTMQLMISDVHGRIIHRQVAAISVGNQEIWLNLGHLATGTYQVTGFMKNERTTTIRFVRQ